MSWGPLAWDWRTHMGIELQPPSRGGRGLEIVGGTEAAAELAYPLPTTRAKAKQGKIDHGGKASVPVAAGLVPSNFVGVRFEM